MKLRTRYRKNMRVNDGVPLDKLPADLHAALSEKFWRECAKVIDPWQAAENIGCKVSFDDDGAPVVTW